MKRKKTISKNPKPQGKRSQTRLGEKPVKLESTLAVSPLALKPAINYWHLNQGRIVGFCILMLLLWVTYLMFYLPDFYLYKASVSGNRVLTEQEIYSAANIDSLSVFWIDPVQVKANIEALPNIKTAQISLTLPANLGIEVEERLPTVIWQTGQATWWIDSEGLFVPPRDQVAINDDRLHIVDLDQRPIEAGHRIDLSIVHGAQIINKFKPEIQDLQYRNHLGLIYYTAEGWPVYVGETLNLEAKLRVADALRADLMARGVVPSFIDVRNPLRSFYVE